MPRTSRLRSRRSSFDQQAKALFAAKREAAQNKVDYHCMHSSCDNLLAARARLVNDIVLLRKRERHLQEQLRLCAR